MESRYFHYLFEKQGEGMVHSGCIHDKANHQVVNYIYMGGFYRKNPLQKPQEEIVAEEQDKPLPNKVHLLILYGYTREYIRKMLKIIERSEVETVIMPYFAPVQRLVLCNYIAGDNPEDKEVVHFLEDPYKYLKNKNIPNIYFLYGNGTVMERSMEEQYNGDNFELADTSVTKLITEMEGYSVPVVRAGYRVTCQWIFYLGVYSTDLGEVARFTRDFFTQSKKENGKKDTMQLLVRAYMRRFGKSPSNTIVLYHGPLYDRPMDNNSTMFQHECMAGMNCQVFQNRGEIRPLCEIRCGYERDYSTMQHHKEKRYQSGKFGVMLLGNVNLNRYLPEIVERFLFAKDRMRVITVPNAASYECWNHHVLEISKQEDRFYYIGIQHEYTSSTVLADIVTACPLNKYMSVDDRYGCCFSGYLIPRTGKTY